MTVDRRYGCDSTDDSQTDGRFGTEVTDGCGTDRRIGTVTVRTGQQIWLRTDGSDDECTVDGMTVTVR